MAQRQPDHTSRKSHAAASAERAPAGLDPGSGTGRRRLRRIADIDGHGADRDAEAAGQGPAGDPGGHAVAGTAGRPALNGKEDKEHKHGGLPGVEIDGDFLMDERDQLALDERIAHEIEDAQKKEAEAQAVLARIKREQASAALARRLAERRKARSPAEPKRFLPQVQVTKLDASMLWTFLTSGKHVIYGFTPANTKDAFEVIFIPKDKVDVMVGTDSPSASISPALRALRDQNPEPPNAPLPPPPRTLPEFLFDEPRPATPAPKPKLASKRPPSMGAGAGVTPAKKPRTIEVTLDDQQSEEPEPEEVCAPTQRVEWSLSPVQVPSSPASPASRLFAKQVDRLARQEAAQAHSASARDP